MGLNGTSRTVGATEAQWAFGQVVFVRSRTLSNLTGSAYHPGVLAGRGSVCLVWSGLSDAGL